jgi:hypothetical protein
MKKTYISPTTKWADINEEAFLLGISEPITGDTDPYPEATNEGLFDEEDDYNNYYSSYNQYLNRKLWEK